MRYYKEALNEYEYTEIEDYLINDNPKIVQLLGIFKVLYWINSDYASYFIIEKVYFFIKINYYFFKKALDELKNRRK